VIVDYWSKREGDGRMALWPVLQKWQVGDKWMEQKWNLRIGCY
jgi:hypothetical protein